MCAFSRADIRAGGRPASSSPRARSRSVDNRTLEKFAPVSRGDGHLQCLPVTVYLKRHLDTGRPERPHRPEELREIENLFTIDTDNDIAHFEPGLLSGAIRGNPGDNDLVVDLSGIKAKPRPRRTLGAANFHEVVDDWFQEIDRDNHIEIEVVALRIGMLDLQRADADQLALTIDQAGTAPVRMGRRSENRLVKKILPVAGELLLRDDVSLDGMIEATSAGDDDRISYLRRR